MYLGFTFYTYIVGLHDAATGDNLVISEEIKVADEVWIATALLHHENPTRTSFRVREIVERAQRENLHPPLRPGVLIHATQHCVSDKEPNPARYRMLQSTAEGGRRLSRPTDTFHPKRDGKMLPEHVPARYQYLLDWYRSQYAKIPNSTTPLLALSSSADDARLTSTESAILAAILGRFARVRAMLNDSLPDQASNLDDWHHFLDQVIKKTLGNTSNDMSFVSGLLAKRYLCSLLSMRQFDMAAKSQSAPGLDIDERTVDGKRVIAEIKTTVPYLGGDFGAMQKENLRSDFAKLVTTTAEHKFFFVTDAGAYKAISRKYAQEIPGVTVVLLPSGDSFLAGTH